MTGDEKREWLAYCLKATPKQLEGIIEREREACERAPDDEYRKECYALVQALDVQCNVR